MLPTHVAGSDDKGAGASREGAAGADQRSGGRGPDTTRVVERDSRSSSMDRLGGDAVRRLMGECSVADECERMRLIGDIMRLIGEPSMPQSTRLAGLTLVGWLARRRLDEPAHAIGIEEARESERRIRSTRAKAR